MSHLRVPAMKVQLEILWAVLSVVVTGSWWKTIHLEKRGSQAVTQVVLQWPKCAFSLGTCFKCRCLTKLNLVRGRKFIVFVTWPHCPHTYQGLKSERLPYTVILILQMGATLLLELQLWSSRLWCYWSLRLKVPLCVVTLFFFKHQTENKNWFRLGRVGEADRKGRRPLLTT